MNTRRDQLLLAPAAVAVAFVCAACVTTAEQAASRPRQREPTGVEQTAVDYARSWEGVCMGTAVLYDRGELVTFDDVHVTVEVRRRAWNQLMIYGSAKGPTGLQSFTIVTDVTEGDRLTGTMRVGQPRARRTEYDLRLQDGVLSGSVEEHAALDVDAPLQLRERWKISDCLQRPSPGDDPG